MLQGIAGSMDTLRSHDGMLGDAQRTEDDEEEPESAALVRLKRTASGMLADVISGRGTGVMFEDDAVANAVIAAPLPKVSQGDVRERAASLTSRVQLGDEEALGVVEIVSPFVNFGDTWLDMNAAVADLLERPPPILLTGDQDGKVRHVGVEIDSMLKARRDAGRARDVARCAAPA
jgi:hypothetical protein